MGLFRRGQDKPAENIPAESLGTPATSAASVDSPSPSRDAAAALNVSNGKTDMEKLHEAEINRLHEIVLDMQRTLNEVAENRSETEKVFDVLHTELQQYKNDFIYEHLKPVLWPLLFLFDSLEQYAREVVGRVSYTGEQTLEAKEVLDHLKFFRGQLVEALRICEVTPMKQPSGQIDPKAHKGIGVEKVDSQDLDNTVRRVVRTGWYLNGKVLRHAEVIIGKYDDPESSLDDVVAAGKHSPAKLSQAAEALRTSSDASASGGGRGGQ